MKSALILLTACSAFLSGNVWSSTSHNDQHPYYLLASSDKESIQQRKAYFKSLPREDRQKIEKARKKYQGLTPEEKQRLKKQWEKKTPEEKARYKKWKSKQQ